LYTILEIKSPAIRAAAYFEKLEKGAFFLFLLINELETLDSP